jgi:hypothetical protein
MGSDIDRLIMIINENQNERRRWNEDALAQNYDANYKHQKASGKVYNVLLVRACIEFLILVALIVIAL